VAILDGMSQPDRRTDTNQHSRYITTGNLFQAFVLTVNCRIYFLHILIDLKQPTDVRFATHQSPESLEIEWKRPECGEAGYIDHYVVVACRLADPDCDCRQGHAETSALGKYTRNIIRDITTYLLSYLPCLKNLN